MSVTNLSDLLPIPNGVETPNAYQVFGLSTDVTDATAIKAAVRRVYADLKTAKSKADPKVWKKAAKLAEASREILSDPAKRAELDNALRNGAVNSPSASSTSGASGVAPGMAPGTPPGMPPGTAPQPPVANQGTPPGVAPMGAAPIADPLAGMLPSADPLAGMLPGQAPVPQSPLGAAPLGAAPMGAAPMGAAPTAGFPPGHAPMQPAAGQLLPGQFPPGQVAPGQPAALPTMPAGQLPPAQIPVQAAGQVPVQPAYASQPVTYPPTGQPVAQPVGQPAAYPQAAVPQQQPQQQTGAVPQRPSPTKPVFKVKKKKKSRRRDAGFGKLLFVGFAFLMAAAIGGLVVFKLLGPDVAVRKDGSVTLNDKQNQQTQQTQQRNPTKKRTQRRDRVMGDMAGDQPPPPPLTSTGIPANKFSSTQSRKVDDTYDPKMGMTDANEVIKGPSMPAEDMSATGIPAPPMDDPNMTSLPSVDPNAMMEVSPGAEAGPAAMSPQGIAAADAKIKQVKQLISESSWTNMKVAAEQLGEMMLTDAQRADSEALYDLADLSLFYRGAIERGMGTLKATQDFDIGGGFRVIVVEVSGTSITVRYGARNKTYSLDDMPFRLADKIAAFSLSPDKPDAIAAKWAYHAVAPLSNDEHRKEAIRWLEQIDVDMPDVNTKAVAELIGALY